MNRSVAFLSAAALALGASTAAFGYSATADVTFTWATGGKTIGWTASSAQAYANSPANDQQVFLQGGNNSTTFYNSDFAIASDYGAGTADDCLTPTPPNYETISLRKYACRQNDTEGYYASQYNKAPETNEGPGAAATGTLTVTDTTLTGTLTVISTTDVPTGATTTFNTCGAPCVGVTVRSSNSASNGFNGYNIRTADGSPFGNAWYGITTSATLIVNLTGTFTNTNWTIDGGAVNFSDSGFACQQGGFGGDARGTLCSASTVGGGFQNNGAHLSWGMDVDASSTGSTVAAPFVVKNDGGTAVIAIMSGVLAHMTLDVGGAIATTDGEFRNGMGNAAGGCLDHVRWGARPPPETGNGMVCGTLSAGPLAVTGTATEVVADTTPDPFTLTDVTNAALASAQSSPITPAAVAGINAPAAISVSGDATSQYSIDGGAFTSAAGTVSAGQTVVVRHTSSAAFSTAVDTVLTIGGVTDTFTSTTVAQDTTPNAFTLADVTDVALASVQSSPITPAAVAGINAPAAISVSGDATSEYQIDGGAFTSAAGTVSAGQTVVVHHTSSATNSTVVTTTLTIGGIADSFTSTTEAAAGGGGGLRSDDGGSSLDALILALLGVTALIRRRR